MKTIIRVTAIFMGIIFGGFIGELVKDISFLNFLSFGKELGLQEPILLDLDAIKLSFGIMIKLNIASILGFILSLIIIKKVVK